MRRRTIQIELKELSQGIPEAEADMISMEMKLVAAGNLAEVPEKLSGLQQSLQELIGKRERLNEELPEVESRLGEAYQALTATLVPAFKPHSQSPLALCQEDSGLTTRMEKILRLLLSQNLAAADLVLFFDALDEFDGHVGLISRFLETPIQPAETVSTRVKVCFSSRPSEQLQARFGNLPWIPTVGPYETRRRTVRGWSACKLRCCQQLNASVSAYGYF